MAISRTGWLARVGIGAALVLAVFAAGTAGYMLVEGWSALDMTVNTASTVGLGEVHPLSPAGKLFTIGVIVLGGGALLYTLTNVVEYVVEGHLAAEVGGRVMEAKIERLRDHFVLCGFGR